MDELVARIAALPPTFARGEGFAYSNSNYVLLGAVIERVAGTPYATALRDGILAPLGMDDTGYDGNEPGEGHAAGYATAAQVIPARHLDMSWPYAAGAMYSTARDLLRWAEALETDAILSAASRALLVRPNLGSYAYGWEIDRRQVNGNRVALHGGAIGGYSAVMIRGLDDRRLTVLLSNYEGAAPSHGRIVRSIDAILAGLPDDAP